MARCSKNERVLLTTVLGPLERDYLRVIGSTRKPNRLAVYAGIDGGWCSRACFWLALYLSAHETL